MTIMTIFPIPKKITYSGVFVNPDRSFCLVRDDFQSEELAFILGRLDFKKGGIPLSMVLDSEYRKEQYTLDLNNTAVRLTASTPRGMFNAIITLQMIIG